MEEVRRENLIKLIKDRTVIKVPKLAVYSTVKIDIAIFKPQVLEQAVIIH